MKNESSDAITFSIPKPSLDKSYVPLLVILLIIAAFLLGMLTTKVQYLEKTGGVVKGAADTVNNPPAKPAAPTNKAAAPNEKVNVEVGRKPILGNKNAKVTVIEFADFQCPFCERLWKETLSQLKKDYIDTGKIKFAFRHYPLPFHQNAQKAAEASECANEQNKFWEYHDLLFENLKNWSPQNATDVITSFIAYATQLNLNTSQFTSCLNSDKYKQQVADDLTAGQKVGVQGTPATFINGQLVSGAQPYTSFKTIIDQELTK